MSVRLGDTGCGGPERLRDSARVCTFRGEGRGLWGRGSGWAGRGRSRSGVPGLLGLEEEAFGGPPEVWGAL